jgi:hypothetical protein
VGFCDGQQMGQVFSENFAVPPANLHSIYFSTIIFTITRGWHNRPEVAAVPIASQSRIKKKKKKKGFGWPYHSSGGWSSASHRGGPGSNPGVVMWNFVMDNSWGRFSPRTLRFPLPIYIPSASPTSSSLSPEAGTIGQKWPQCQ